MVDAIYRAAGPSETDGVRGDFNEFMLQDVLATFKKEIEEALGEKKLFEKSASTDSKDVDFTQLDELHELELYLSDIVESIDEQLTILQSRADKIPSEANKLPEMFVSAVRKIERSLGILDVGKALDITAEAFKLADKKAHIWKNVFLVRRSGNREYDYNVCKDCKTKLTDCLEPEDLMDAFISDTKQSKETIIVMYILLLINPEGEEKAICPEAEHTTHANMLVVNKDDKMAYIAEPNTFSPEQTNFYEQIFKPMALKKLGEKWNIHDIVLEKEAACQTYTHGGLCAYANALTYLFPETRCSVREFALKVVAILQRMCINKGLVPAQSKRPKRE